MINAPKLFNLDVRSGIDVIDHDFVGRTGNSRI